MNYEEFQRHIGKAGLRLNEFAALMDMSPSSVSNYRKKGLVPRHLAVIAVLLGEMGERGIDFRPMPCPESTSSQGRHTTQKRLKPAVTRRIDRDKEKQYARLRLQAALSTRLRTAFPRPDTGA